MKFSTASFQFASRSYARLSARRRVRRSYRAHRVAGHDDALAGDLARRGVAALGDVVHEPDADPAVREQGAPLEVEESFRGIGLRRQAPRLFDGAPDGIEVRIGGHGGVVLVRAHRAYA